jgi:hypothetical protein
MTPPGTFSERPSGAGSIDRLPAARTLSIAATCAFHAAIVAVDGCACASRGSNITTALAATMIRLNTHRSAMM